MSENGLQIVLRYKTRLNPHNETKKILRALQKLSEVEMTIDILQETGIGKVVNNLRKHEEVGGFAKELVSSWKQLLSNKPQNKQNSSNKYQSGTTDSQTLNNDEYDPSGNWQMKKEKEKKKKLKYSSESEEYDPTQNWKMDKSDEYSPEYPKITKTMKKQKLKHNKQNKSSSKVPYHQPTANESSFLPNVSDSDEDYSSNEDCVDSHPPSVSSTTLYSNKTDSKLHVSTNGNSLYEKQHKKQKNDEREINDKQKNSASPIKSSKAMKRKSDAFSNESPSTKVKKSTSTRVDKVKKEVKKESAGNLSFEDFMAMDTTKKIKKKKKSHQKSASTSQFQNNFSSSKQKVELHLPKVQSVYRPLPQSDPTDPYIPSTSNHPASRMTDAMAAELHSQRSSGRMQIYSGQKTTYLPKMMSLYDQCMNVLMNNIDKLDVIGVPYDIIKPVLERCTAEQLYHLEDINVYLLEDTDELWQKLSQQDFRGKVPDEMESWRELYLRLHDAREEKLARLTQTIQAKVIKSKPLEKRTKLAYVGIGQAKAPRNVQRAQLKYGTAGKRQIQSTDANGTSSLKQQTTELRMSVPVGSITAASVDAQSTSRGWSKKQPPRVAPMMAKTLKTINKLRMRR